MSIMLGAQAQDKTFTLNPVGYKCSFQMTSADVVTQADKTFYVQLGTSKSAPFTYVATTTLHKNSGTPRVMVTLRGKMKGATSWTGIDSCVCTTSSDSTIVFTIAASTTYSFLSINYAANTATQNVLISTCGFQLADYNITGAKGNTGATGVAGATGATGANGAAGSNGANGSTGAAGAIGQTGSQGTAGNQGNIGYAGQTGAVGGTGASGANGAIGDTGANGATGQTGAASTVAGPNGATGQTGANGAVGGTGASGSNGAVGNTGATGSASTLEYAHATTGVTASAAEGAVAFTTGANNLTFTLNAAATYANGKIFYVLKDDAGVGTVTIAADGSEKINGVGTLVLSYQWNSAEIINTGTGWLIRHKVN